MLAAAWRAYSQFQQYLDAKNVKEVTVAGNVIRGTLDGENAGLTHRFQDRAGPS